MQNNCLFIEIKPTDVGLFRFLLEAYDNLAYFTVLEPKTALLKVCSSLDQSQKCLEALQAISTKVQIKYLDF